MKRNTILLILALASLASSVRSANTYVDTTPADWFNVGHWTAGSPDSSDIAYIGATAYAKDATVDIASGNAAVQQLYVGFSSVARGVLNVSNGNSLNITIHARVAYAANSTGVLNIAHGTVTNSRALYVQDNTTAGEAQVLLGDANNSGSYYGTSLSMADIDIRDATAGSASVEGWGVFSCARNFINNGRVVANGYGVDRDLTISFGSLTDNDLAITQGDGTLAGWYAGNRGRLVLPPLDVTGDTSWGEASTDSSLDLVNSARLASFSGLSGGDVTGSLLAIDRTDIPAGLMDAVGVWEFVPGSLSFSTANLTLRYDDALASQIGVAETNLVLFQYTGGTWVDVTSSIDTGAKTITASGVTSLSMFAIAVGADVVPPGSVTGMSAMPGHEQIKLSWTNPQDADLAGILVLRALGVAPDTAPANGTSYGVSDTIGNATVAYAGSGSTETFSDTGLVNGSTYHYRVFAFDGAPNYSSGAATSESPVADSTPPAAITGLSATALTESTIRLAWTIPADPDFEGVVILRSMTGDPAGVPSDDIDYTTGTNIGTDLVVFSGNAAAWIDTGLTSSVMHYYKVFARDEVPNYSAGESADATTLADTFAPADVSGLTATMDDQQIALSLSSPADLDFEGVIVTRKVGSAPGGQPTDTTTYTTSDSIAGDPVVYAGSAEGWTNTSLVNGTHYYYKVFTHDEVPNYSAGVVVDETPNYRDYTLGELRTYSTIHSIGIEWDIATGDTDHDSVCTVQFREQGETTWQDFIDLFRVDFTSPVSDTHVPGDYSGFDMHAGSVMFLDPGATYEVKLALTDPDGGSDQRTVTVATRPIPSLPTGGRTFHVSPGAGGGTGTTGDPFLGIDAAQAVALPGDIFLLHAGDYGGRIELDVAGTPTNYVVWKAAGDGNAVIGGIDVVEDHIWIEGFLLDVSDKAVNTLGTDPDPDDVVVVRNTIVNAHNAIYLMSGGGDDWYIADNTMTGNTDPSSGSTDGEGVELGHTSGHTVCNNTISRFADGISYPRSNCDFFGNDIFDCSDDGIEPDYAYANIRMWENRIHNIKSYAFSFQPMLGGPWYIIRNQAVGSYQPLKLVNNNPTTRTLLAHNLFTGEGWDGQLVDQNTDYLFPMHSYNNFWISRPYAGSSPWICWENGDATGNGDWQTDLDYDAFDWGSYTWGFKWGGHANEFKYTTVPAFYAATGLEQHGIRIQRATCFATWNVPSPRPASVPPQHMTLQSSSPARNKGCVLPGINDDYEGSAPDIGPYEYNAELPQYGRRPVTINTYQLRDSVVGNSYSETLQVSGDYPGFTWAVSSGSLPDGLNLSTNGVVSGTSTAQGTNTFTAQVTDSTGTNSASRQFSLVVTAGDAADDDNDNLPDDWEVANFGGTNVVGGGQLEDMDLDGQSNFDEFVAGTDPNNLTAGSDTNGFQLRITMSNDNPAVSFKTIAVNGYYYGYTNRTYTMEKADSMVPGAWKPVDIGGATNVTATGGWLYHVVAGTNQAYFRGAVRVVR